MTRFISPPSTLQPGASVWAYLRDSGGESQERSTDRQLDELRAYCQQYGLILIRYFVDDAISGRSTQRDGFQEMLRASEAKDARPLGLLLWNYARFARNLDEAIHYKAQLRMRGIAIHSLTDPVPEGPFERVIETLIDMSNEEKSRQTSADSKSGLMRIVREHGAVPGVPPVGIRRVPIKGVINDRTGKERSLHRWEPDPEIAPRVLKAFEMRAAGQTIGEIHRTLRLYGVRNSYKTFFTNKIYLGILDYGGVTFENYCKPMVPRKLWESVQPDHEHRFWQKGGDTRNHPRRKNSRFLLSGLAHCAQCGSPMHGRSSIQKSGARYESYLCNRAYNGLDCTRQRIPRPAFEKAVIDELVSFILQDDNMRTLRAALHDQQAGQVSEHKQRLIVARRELGQLRRKIDRLAKAVEESGHSRALLSRLSELESQETAQLSTISALDGKHIPAYLPIPEAESEAMLTAMREVLLGGDTQKKRVVLQGLVEAIYIDREGNTLKGVIHYYPMPGHEVVNVHMDRRSRRGSQHTHITKHKFTSSTKIKAPQ